MGGLVCLLIFSSKGSQYEVLGLASSVVRGFEATATSRVFIASGAGGEEIVEIAKNYAESVGLKEVEIKYIGEVSRENLVNDVKDKFQWVLDREKCSAIIAIPTPASRRIATAVGLAVASLKQEKASIGFLDFYWGPWSGLPYPYVPRNLEPLYLLPPSIRPKEGWMGVRAKYKNLIDAGCRVPGLGIELGPLRCRIASLAAQLNSIAKGVEAYDVEKGEWSHWSLTISVKPLSRLDILPRINISLETPRDWCRLASHLANLFKGIEKRVEGHRERSALEELLFFTGLHRYEPCGRVESRETIIDTNLVYSGIHNYAYLGSKIALPYCLIVEIERRMAEAEKPGRRDIEKLLDTLAYYGLIELRKTGVSILPSQPLSCDIAIPGMDSLLLDSRHVATRDSGAKRFWEKHPASRIYSKIVFYGDHCPRNTSRGAKLVYYRSLKEWSSSCSSLEASWAAYASLQALVVLASMKNTVDWLKDIEVIVKTGDMEASLQIHTVRL